MSITPNGLKKAFRRSGNTLLTDPHQTRGVLAAKTQFSGGDPDREFESNATRRSSN